MAKTRRPIRLNQNERNYLQGVYDGTFPKTKRQRAAILLRADENRDDGGLTDHQIATALEYSVRGIQRVRKVASEDGLQSCIEGRYSGRPHVRKITGDVEAKLIALSCSKPPQGRVRWTLRLLAGRLVELEILDSIDPVIASQATVEKGVIRIHQLSHRSIDVQERLQERVGLGQHRVLYDDIEVWIEFSIGLGEIDIDQIKPLRRKVFHKPRSPRVSINSPIFPVGNSLVWLISAIGPSSISMTRHSTPSKRVPTHVPLPLAAAGPVSEII